MTATNELRRLLDERGVEWGNIRNDGSESDYLTEWQFENNQGKAIAIEWAVGSGLSVEIHRYHLTPEQAIATTLGAGTCKLINAADDLGKGTSSCMCFECGYTALDDWWNDFKYCPNCGRRIEQ